MRTSLDCLPCIVRQAVDASRMVMADEPTVLKIMKIVFERLACLNLSATPPEIVREVHAVIRRELHDVDPFLSIKKKSTQRALDIAGSAKVAIESAGNPFAAAVAFSIAGNILDFGMRSEWNEALIAESFSKALECSLKFDDTALARFHDEIATADMVLVLGDNAGEAVFDRLLIEHFPRRKKVFYAVKSSPVINDATREDAVEASIAEVAEIIANGADIPGTMLGECSEEFLRIFHTADVVISKGQGNFETLNEAKRKIWFLFQVKCPVIAKHYAYSVGDWMILEKSRNDSGCTKPLR
ncbi:ARMT1-like domain-containing protein [Desulfomicrobium sp. ZS1]|uniref:damage-control phosphatase ARMT1 family protein n=1 Tax=Desulfomicrobium sp. ZS1 TaxID=2952228 RepID=UPI0020B412D5|nr:ARMT1-like domain-containing protein [Desulfomicrobium sp. ZS1]UTF51367.1 ARMT1-like domain-containing protein [Desulfomicrobium sp. ZS1]